MVGAPLFSVACVATSQWRVRDHFVTSMGRRTRGKPSIALLISTSVTRRLSSERHSRTSCCCAPTLLACSSTRAGASTPAPNTIAASAATAGTAAVAAVAAVAAAAHEPTGTKSAERGMMNEQTIVRPTLVYGRKECCFRQLEGAP